MPEDRTVFCQPLDCGLLCLAQPLGAGPTTDERERIKALEREVRELRQANEIFRTAFAYLAMAELDHRLRT